MSLIKRVGLLAGTTALTLTCGSLAGTGADAEKQSDLEARLAAAEAKIAQMSATSKDNWLTEQRSEEIRSLVQDVLADADDTRSSLLSQGVTAGYDNGAVLGSSDGNWLLKTNILMQQRFVFNNRSNDVTPTVDENLWGFENTRTKFMLSGHVVNPDWTYRIDIEVGANPARGGTTNAYIGYDYGDGWKVTMGQMKAPLLREDLVEAQNQLAVERSVLNYAFTAGYTTGIALSNEGEQFRFTAMLSNGARFVGAAVAPDTDFAFTGRVEWLAMGNWGQFEDFTSPQGSEQGLMVGAALHYEAPETGLGGYFDTELTLLTIDVSWEGDGWNAYFAYIMSDWNLGATPPIPTPDANGFIVQGGYYLDESWEIFGRYEAADWDTPLTDDLGIFTIGVNKYFAGHNAKWTTDIGFGTDGVDGGGAAGPFAFIPAGVTNFLADDGTPTGAEDGQIVLRTQLQILF